MMSLLRKCCLGWLLLAVAMPLYALPTTAKHVQVSLVSAESTIVPGQPFTVAVHFKIDPHWHTYWRNPGDSGLATSIKWQLPPGFSASDIHWPTPQRLPFSGMVNFGYQDEVYHLVTITAPKDLANDQPVTLNAIVEWLECADICQPGQTQVRLQLNVGTTSQASPQAVKLQAEEQALPIPNPQAVTGATRDQHNLILHLGHLPDELANSKNLWFFPYAEQLIDNTATPVRGSQTLSIPLADNAIVPATISGILTDGEYQHAIEFSTSLGTATPVLAPTSTATVFSLALPLAFLGGLILNLMPCVFPVLGIKILGFVNQAGQSRRKIIQHGLAFTAGILVSFWLLAGLLIALRTGGQQLGWGFQLQSPTFVYALTVILFLFGLNLSGVFEFGTSLIGLGGNRVASQQLGGSFCSGVLATVVATPCAAPFLATALGTALTLRAAPSLLLFTAIALGLAAPYLIISIWPQLLRFLPKPGAWMESFKQLLSFPLYASAAFLLWVLAGQVGDIAFLSILLSLAVLAMAVWIYGRWTGPQHSSNRRALVRLIVLLLMVGGLYYGWPKSQRSTENHIAWQKWSPELVSQLQAAGKPIYVDFTARWCATCQTNKALVFSSKEVLAQFEQQGVVPLRADWTNQDPQITAELAKYGKSAVPFNLLYLPGRNEPIQLPALLTPQIVLDALGTAPK